MTYPESSPQQPDVSGEDILLDSKVVFTLAAAAVVVTRVVVSYVFGSSLKFKRLDSRQGTLAKALYSDDFLKAAAPEPAGSRTYESEFVLRSAYRLKGLVPVATGVRWVDFQDGFLYASQVPVKVRFDRIRTTQGTDEIVNLVVERGDGLASVAYGTELSVEIGAAVQRASGVNILELTFDWNEAGRVTRTQPLAQLKIWANGHVFADDAFKAAVGDQWANVRGDLLGPDSGDARDPIGITVDGDFPDERTSLLGRKRRDH